MATLSEQRLVFALDVERNDVVEGDVASKAFNAIAVKVLDMASGQMVGEYAARLPDEWFSGNFAQRLLPSLRDIRVVNSTRELFADFWEFWSPWHAQGVNVWADTAKLETIFFEEIMDFLGKGFREGPWRVDDVRVLMLALGYDADELRSIEFAGLDGKANRHDPRDDCKIVIGCLRRCLTELDH